MDKLIKHVKQVQILSMILSMIAMVFCTSVGIKMIMDDCLGIGLCNIVLGVCNLLLCICNIMRLVAQSAGI